MSYPNSPKAPENVKITTQYRCTGRHLTAANDSCCDLQIIWKWILFSGKGGGLRHFLGKWVKGYFFRATQSTQLVYVNQQACEKGYALYKQLKQIVFQRLIYHRLKYLNRQTCDKKVIVFTKVSNKLVSKRVLFQSLIHKKGVSRSKEHSEKVGFQRFADAHADPAHPPPPGSFGHTENLQGWKTVDSV